MSFKLGLFLTSTPPPLSPTYAQCLMYMCHKKNNPPLRDVIHECYIANYQFGLYNKKCIVFCTRINKLLNNKTTHLNKFCLPLSICHRSLHLEVLVALECANLILKLLSFWQVTCLQQLKCYDWFGQRFN